jgi:ligand-binding sensor domain-containing protein/ABC-type iron transport system FetAB ATPase subunit
MKTRSHGWRLVMAQLMLLTAACGPSPPKGRLEAWDLPHVEPAIAPSFSSLNIAPGANDEFWIAADDKQLLHGRLGDILWKSVALTDVDAPAVMDVTVAPDNTIWTAQGGKIGMFDGRTYRLLSTDSGVPSTCHFLAPQVSAAGTIIDFSDETSSDIVEFDKAKNRFVNLHAPDTASKPSLDAEIGYSSAVMATDRSVWRLYEGKLYRTPVGGKQILIESLELDRGRYGALFAMRSGEVWLLALDNPIRASLTPKPKLQVFSADGRLLTPKPIDLPPDATAPVTEDAHSRTWFTTDGNGMELFDRREQTSQYFVADKNSTPVSWGRNNNAPIMDSMSSGQAMLFDFDREQWMPLSIFHGLPGNEFGDFSVTTNGQSTHIQVTTERNWSSRDGLCGRIARSSWDIRGSAWRMARNASVLSMGPTGTIWAQDEFDRDAVHGYGTDGSDVRLDLAASDGASVERKFAQNISVLEDSSGEVWIGTADGNLRRCDAKSRTCEKFSTKHAFIELPDSNPVLVEDHDKQIWFLANGRVLQIDPSREILHEFRRAEDKPFISIGLDSHKRLWTKTERQIIPPPSVGPPLDLPSDVPPDSVIRSDASGAIWLVGKSNSVKRIDPDSREIRDLVVADSSDYSNEDFQSSNSRRIDIANNGSLWYRHRDALVEQQWRNDGLPKRPIVYYLSANYPRLMAFGGGVMGEVIWRTRRTGLLRIEGGNVTAFPFPDAVHPITALQSDGSGGAWLGQAGAGVSYYDGAHSFQRVPGLPDSNVRSLSAIPGAKAPRAWAATDAGAARISPAGVEIKAELGIGPIDLIASTSEGGAWIALNPLDPQLSLTSSNLLKGRRFSTLLQLDARGLEIQRLALSTGQINALTLSADGKVLWVGTERGLYRLRNGSKDVDLITAQGRLDNSPVSIIAADPAGTVWLGINGLGPASSPKGSPARVVGYNPRSDDIDALNTDRGLPQVSHIDSLVLRQDGDLVLNAGDRLLKGPVFVPTRGLWPWILTSVTVFILFGVGVNQVWRIRRQRRAEAAAYQPLSELCQTFFDRAGKGKLIHSGLSYLRSNSIDQKIIVHLSLGRLLAVEDIQHAFTAITAKATRAADDKLLTAYLAHQVDMDPAARRQLDVYRVKDGVAMIPLSAPFMRSKLQEGESAARVGLDGLYRRYQSQQDLFDMKNAIDEARFFFGRKSLLGDLQNSLTRGEHVALLGPRKAGKSSLLNLLEQRLESFPIVKSDFELFSRRDIDWPEKLLRQLVFLYDQWGRSYFDDESWQPPLLPDGTVDGLIFKSALQARRDLQVRLGNEQTLVILLDEIERVFPNARDDETLRHEAERFNYAAGVLRALGQASGDRLLSLVIADTSPNFVRINVFNALGTETNPFYRFLQERYVTPLDHEECTEMLTEISMAMGLSMNEPLIDKIYGDSGGHAALARRLASAACQQRNAESCVAMDHYTIAIAKLADTGELDDYFDQNYWAQANDPERHILVICCDEDGVQEIALRFAGDKGENSTLLDARRHLLATGILERHQSRLRVTGALFRQWLRGLSNH